MKYKLICEHSTELLEDEVNNWLNKGWVLSGNHQMAKDADGHRHFSQALKYDNSSQNTN